MVGYLPFLKDGQHKKPASFSRKQHGLVSPCLCALADVRIGSGGSERPETQPESPCFSHRYSARHPYSCSCTRSRTLFFPEKCARCTPPPLPTLPLALNLFRWTPMMTRRATKVTLPLAESHGPGYSSARGSYARSRVRALAAREHQQGQCDTAGRQNHVHRHSGPHLERAGSAGRAIGQAVGRHACTAAGTPPPRSRPRQALRHARTGDASGIRETLAFYGITRQATWTHCRLSPPLLWLCECMRECFLEKWPAFWKSGLGRKADSAVFGTVVQLLIIW